MQIRGIFRPRIMKVVKQECTVHPKKLEINEYIVYEIN